MDWFRLDHGFFHCPKVVRLSREMRSFLVDMWCVSSSQRVRGAIPSADDMAVHWRVKPGRARQVLAKLIEAGFVDEDEATGRLTVHDWHEWQKPSDDAGAIKKAQRSKKSPAFVHGQSMDCPPLDTELDRDKENTPLYPPNPGGRHALATVVDSGELDASPPQGVDPPGSPEYRAVLAAIPDGWRLAAEQTAINLLSRLPARAVLFGLEETLEKFEGPFTRKVAGYWKAVVEENPGGRPARPQSQVKPWQRRQEGPQPNAEAYRVHTLSPDSPFAKPRRVLDVAAN